MAGTTDAVTRRPLRADAAGNRRKLLDAAREVFTELGPGAPLDEIARRAGTGIATLYRRFADRQTLMRDVVLDAIERSAEEARLAAVIPALLGEVLLDDEKIEQARAAAPTTVEALIDAAQRAGTLRPDVTSGDIGMLIVRMSRPLPGAFTRQVNRALSHCHLDLLIDGLRPAAPPPAQLSGPALTFDDLRNLR